MGYFKQAMLKSRLIELLNELPNWSIVCPSSSRQGFCAVDFHGIAWPGHQAIAAKNEVGCYALLSAWA